MTRSWPATTLARWLNKRTWARRRTDSSSNVSVICDFSRILTSTHSQTFCQTSKVWLHRPAKAISSVHFARALAVIFTVAAFAALLLPVFVKAKIKAQRTNCISNFAPTGFAWVSITVITMGVWPNPIPISIPTPGSRDMRNAQEATISIAPARQTFTLQSQPTGLPLSADRVSK